MVLWPLCRAVSPTKGARASVNFAGLRAERQSAADGLKETFLRERLVQLEAELKAAQRKEGLLETDAKKVSFWCVRAYSLQYAVLVDVR